ncbi:MAG TPA: ATP-binding protein [Pyrinomonadaceae bacterium]|nr:ATP-binding protein [Pyrinomonadaceae bacterium]
MTRVLSRYSLFLGVVCVLLAVVILILFPATNALFIGLLSLSAGLLLASGYFHKQSEQSSNPKGERQSVASGRESTEEFASGTLLEATMSGMREGLVVVDRDLRVVASNSAAHKLFALADGNPNRKRLTELTRNPAIYDAFLDALKGKERSGVKVEIHEPSRRIFDLRVVPLGDDDGGPTDGAIGVFFDISRLEKLERVRQEFLSNVSHELRTPLTAILAFVETLESDKLEENDDNRRFLAIIRKNAARMQHLIDDILELSAIEAGNVRVEPRDVELRPLVNDVVASLAARAAAGDITIDNQIDSDAVIHADARRLEQMLTNLLENAIKFNRKQGRVSIRSEAGALDRIMVQDTGEGIPAQHLERLFERFYRVDRARSRELGGTGLGLAIVKHLARAHGGDVRVESKLGEGSVFLIELPASKTNGLEAGDPL